MRIDDRISRRDALRRIAALAAPAFVAGCRETGDPGVDLDPPEPGVEPATEQPLTLSEDEERLRAWCEALLDEGLAANSVPFGAAAIRVGELAIGTPYEAFALEEYIRAGGSPARSEPLTLSLTKFDCVSLVESCIAVARVARSGEPPEWEAFAAEMERMRYRDGVRRGYSSRLHYFSDWLEDNARRGLVRHLGEELGGVPDTRPLRFMTSNPESYPAMAYPEVRTEIAEMERALDDNVRWVIPTERIPEIADRLETGDILAFATSISGLDVTHAAFAYRDSAGALTVLHAPLSGGVVEITHTTVPRYVSAIRQSTGILVARPLDGN